MVTRRRLRGAYTSNAYLKLQHVQAGLVISMLSFPVYCIYMDCSFCPNVPLLCRRLKNSQLLELLSTLRRHRIYYYSRVPIKQDHLTVAKRIIPTEGCFPTRCYRTASRIIESPSGAPTVRHASHTHTRTHTSTVLACVANQHLLSNPSDSSQTTPRACSRATIPSTRTGRRPQRLARFE